MTLLSVSNAVAYSVAWLAMLRCFEGMRIETGKVQKRG
jgi:hypothetical protein